MKYNCDKQIKNKKFVIKNTTDDCLIVYRFER